MGTIRGVEYDAYRTNPETEEREYHIVDEDEWMTAEDIRVWTDEVHYWMDIWPREIVEECGEDNFEWVD